MATLHLLGSGTPTPTPQRFGTSYVLALPGTQLMIDCGPATTHKLVKAGLWPTQIDCLLFTHHHFDHNADYPCFLLCRWDQSTGEEKRLTIRGPEPTARITARLIGPEGAFVEDWQARVNHPTSQSVHRNRGGSLPRPEPVVDVADLDAGAVIAGDGWRAVTARAAHMEPWLHSLAYRIETPEGSITFAGDTQPCPGVSELARGSDVLVVNCWDRQQTMDENGEAPSQTGTLDAARMATESGARLLILTHTGPALCRPGTREAAVAEIGRHYAGEIIFGEELLALPLW